MRSRWNLLIVLVYMGVASLGLGYMAVNMGGPCLGDSLPSVLASTLGVQKCLAMNVEFRDTAGLLRNNDVRVAGVKAGQVQSISVHSGLALASVKVQQAFTPVYRDAHAVVRPKNLLGETFIEIDRGSPAAGEMGPGDTIPAAQTLTPAQVDQVLDALDPNTRQKLQIIINAAGEAAAQRGQDFNFGAADLSRVAQDLAVTSTSLNGESDNIDALLIQLDKIQQTAADYHQQLAQVLSKWADVSQTVMAHDVALSNAFSHLDGVLGDLDQGLSPNAPALAAAVTTLPQTLDDTTTFLGVSNRLSSLYAQPVSPGAMPTMSSAVDLFPRLAQVMMGANACDTHIYANYQNTPGTTEPAACPAAGGPLVDPFGGGDQAKGDSTTGGNRHLWRVMLMFDAAINGACGFESPGGLPSSTCSPGTTGLEPYVPTKINGASVPGFPPAATPTAPRVGTSFWARLWSDIAGGSDA